jgi:hypothetical protein
MRISGKRRTVERELLAESSGWVPVGGRVGVYTRAGSLSCLEQRVRRNAELEDGLKVAAGMPDHAPSPVFFSQIMHFFVPAVDGRSERRLLGGSRDDSRAGHFRRELLNQLVPFSPFLVFVFIVRHSAVL